MVQKTPTIDDYAHRKDLMEISEELNRKLASVERTKVPYRVINHWSSEGLLIDTREGDNKWRKFGLVDLIWIEIIKELRKYGLNLDVIKKIYNEMFFDIHDKEKRKPTLEYHIYLTLQKTPVSLMITEEGICTIIKDFDSLEVVYKIGTFMGKNSYILVNLNGLVQKILTKADTSPIFDTLDELTIQERKLVDEVRKDRYSKISLRTENGEIVLFEGTELVTAGKDIEKLLREEKYQDIEITQSDGKIIRLGRTVKKKL